jgi:hypothetical protein
VTVTVPVNMAVTVTVPVNMAVTVTMTVNIRQPSERANLDGRLVAPH